MVANGHKVSEEYIGYPNKERPGSRKSQITQRTGSKLSAFSVVFTVNYCAATCGLFAIIASLRLPAQHWIRCRLYPCLDWFRVHVI